tara:strand:+ start:500 stop:1435 length:936 start_codon:yes stop_codon:yes gene_type:complete
MEDGLQTVLIFWEHDEIAKSLEPLVGGNSDSFFNNETHYTSEWEIQLNDWLEESNYAYLFRIYSDETSGWMGIDQGRLAIGIGLRPNFGESHPIKLSEKIRNLENFYQMAVDNGIEMPDLEYMAFYEDDMNNMCILAKDAFDIEPSEEQKKEFEEEREKRNSNNLIQWFENPNADSPEFSILGILMMGANSDAVEAACKALGRRDLVVWEAFTAWDNAKKPHPELNEAILEGLLFSETRRYAKAIIADRMFGEMGFEQNWVIYEDDVRPFLSEQPKNFLEEIIKTQGEYYFTETPEAESAFNQFIQSLIKD